MRCRRTQARSCFALWGELGSVRAKKGMATSDGCAFLLLRRRGTPAAFVYVSIIRADCLGGPLFGTIRR